MTFKEAQKLKESLPETYHHMGIDLEYIVIPALEADIARYRTYFTYNIRGGDVEDEEVVDFSSNGQFILGGFWTDDVDVIFDDKAPVKL